MVAEHVTKGLITLTPPLKPTCNMELCRSPCLLATWNHVGSRVGMCLKSWCWPPTPLASKSVTGFAAHSAARSWRIPTCCMPEPAFLPSEAGSVWFAMQPKGNHVTCTQNECLELNQKCCRILFFRPHREQTMSTATIPGQPDHPEPLSIHLLPPLSIWLQARPIPPRLSDRLCQPLILTALAA